MDREEQLNVELREVFIGELEKRFYINLKRYRLHEGMNWKDVAKALREHPEKLWSLWQMEKTGGEPDVIEENEGEFIFGDCSNKTPSGRRDISYDAEGQAILHKKVKSNGNAVDMAKEMGVELMEREQYMMLLELLNFDRGTSSWLKTPPDIRKKPYRTGKNSGAGSALKGAQTLPLMSGLIYLTKGVVELPPFSSNEHTGFRAVLRIPKAA
ncbi:DUF4256 domain-containing protein [Pseudomonadota bacterium]